MKKNPKELTIACGLILYAVVLFRVVWPEGVVIQSIDYNYGLMAMYKSELPGAFFEGFWRGFPLLGRVGTTPPTFTNLLLAVLPIEFYMDWIYPLHLLLSSGFLIGFLRLRKLGWTASILGALTAFWLGSNLTLIHPGHLLKYGVVLCAAATLFCVEKTHQTRSWRWAVLSGGTLGWMFMHQADLALFFGLLLGGYHLFRSSEAEKKSLPRLGIATMLLLITAGLITWESFENQMETQVRNVAVLQQGDDQEKWEFATQWSFPPAESLDLIAPGYWGWTSSHETVPYHGVTGQSPEWETNQQGFPNLKMESVYVGILPIGLIFLAWLGKREQKKEVLFWTLALVFTLLLSFGKFTPFYRLFFQLPLVNVIRNPNKFLQVFQLCLGVLTAFGLQALLHSATPKQRTRAAWGFMSTAIGFGIGSLLIHPHSAAQLDTLAETIWASRAGTILQQKQLALLHTSLLSGWVTLCLFGMKHPKWIRPAGFALVVAMCVEGAFLGRHYLKPNPVEFIQENALVDFLKENLGSQRVAALQPDGLSAFYFTHLFPAHHIPFADIVAAPRLEEDMQQYLNAIGANRFRLWQEFGVKYVLAPRSLSEQLMQRVSSLQGTFTEAWSYSLNQQGPGRLELLPGTTENPGPFLLLKVEPPSERFSLLNHAVPASADESLQAVSSSEPPLRKARVLSASFNPIMFSENPGTINQVLSSRNGFLLSVEVDAPRAFLRLADRYDPTLRASINGEAATPLLQTDFLFAGLELPQGTHEVELFSEQPVIGRLVQAGGLFLTLGVALSLLPLGSMPAKKSDVSSDPTAR